MDNRIDVYLIGRRTVAVAPLIFCVLVNIEMWVLARSRLFENWAVLPPVARVIWLVLLAH